MSPTAEVLQSFRAPVSVGPLLGPPQVRDAAGNDARPARRRIYVLDPCPPFERVCTCGAGDGGQAAAACEAGGATLFQGVWYTCSVASLCASVEVDFDFEEEQVRWGSEFRFAFREHPNTREPSAARKP